MAIVSLGQPGSARRPTAFNVPFDVIAHGVGYFGNGLLYEDAGKTLRGQEGNGTIQFFGPVTCDSLDDARSTNTGMGSRWASRVPTR